MQRTTLSLEDRVLRELRRRALEKKVSLAKLVNRMLSEALDGEKARRKSPRLSRRWKPVDCGAPLVDLADREALLSAMEDGS